MDPDEQTEHRSKLNGITGKNGEHANEAKTLLTKLQKILMEKNYLT